MALTTTRTVIRIGCQLSDQVELSVTHDGRWINLTATHGVEEKALEQLKSTLDRLAHDLVVAECDYKNRLQDKRTRV